MAPVVSLDDRRTLKDIGGSGQKPFNHDLVRSLAAALPKTGLRPADQIAALAVSSLLAYEPQDAVEGNLATQIVAANAASLEMYRRAWIPGSSPELQMKYLSLADKAARTVATLTETLDRHRGRGQQQITVRHVTVNAEQAVVADQIITGDRQRDGGA